MTKSTPKFTSFKKEHKSNLKNVIRLAKILKVISVIILIVGLLISAGIASIVIARGSGGLSFFSVLSGLIVTILLWLILSSFSEILMMFVSFEENLCEQTRILKRIETKDGYEEDEE